MSFDQDEEVVIGVERESDGLESKGLSSTKRRRRTSADDESLKG